MSHFSVLVIGEDPESQLAPYHEFECTGVDDQYVQDIDITDEVREQIGKDGQTLVEALEESGLDKKIVESESLVDREEAHKYGYAIVRNGELLKAVNRTNPNKKWDWYQLGGRFTGSFKLKGGNDGRRGEPGLMTEAVPHGYADQARKGAIDFIGMQDEAEDKARQLYHRFYEVLGKNAMPRSWAAVRGDFPGNIEAARNAYHEQPGIKAIQKHDEFRWYNDVVVEFNRSEDDYVKLARNRAVSSFAVVKDSQWYERGQMGWWAIVLDEKDEERWHEEMAKLVEAADDDTLFSMFDCHI